MNGTAKAGSDSQMRARGFHKAGARRRRGVALLLVMIGLVVCSLLTAGFLASQGTAIGIARNERDAEKARAVAQSGIDMACWLIKNRADWRTAMAPGTWLNAVTVGEGTVTLKAASGDGTSSFANDTTQPAVLTSVGTVAGRTFMLTATIGPTGGGTVFRGGNFCQGAIKLGSSDLDGSATIDSYNSSVAAYNSLFPGSNAIFGTNYSGNYGLTVYFLSFFRGSFIGGSKENLSRAVYATLLVNGPLSTALNTQPFTPGTVVPPNTAGLAAKGAFSHVSAYNLSDPGKYDSFSIGPTSITTTNVTVTNSGTYYFTGNFTINALSNLLVPDGVNAVIVVDGNVTLGGSIKFAGSGTVALYVNGNTTLNGSAGINFIGQNTSNFTLLGTGNGNITLNSTSQIFGAIYAPNSSVQLQSSSAKVYGAIVSKDLTLLNSTAFHFDENLKGKRIDNITGGSAPSGTAGYSLTIVGSTH